MFNATNSSATIWKSKNIFSSFFCISTIYRKFGILWNKRWASVAISFWNYRLEKVGLFKYLKSPVSGHLTLMDSQHFKRSERLLKWARQSFCQIFWSLSKKFSSKNLVLVAYEILRLCVNIFTRDEKYFLSVKESVSRNHFKWNYLQTKKYFSLFLRICKIYIKFGIVWKKTWPW